MELKHPLLTFVLFVVSCFNRTFMELKPNLYLRGADLYSSFNRTFMELKLKEVQDIAKSMGVLIGPSWN